MLAQLTHCGKVLQSGDGLGGSHILFVLPQQRPEVLPWGDVLEARLKRRQLDYADLGKTPLCADLPQGSLVVWVVLRDDLSVFERHALLRKAMAPLLDEKPDTLTLAVLNEGARGSAVARDAVYVAWVNGATLPAYKQKPDARPLSKIALFAPGGDDFSVLAAVAEGNVLARSLTMMPPNTLTPAHYRDRIRLLAREHGWQHKAYDCAQLRAMGAGAFVAVAQGSGEDGGAAIVRLTYTPENALGKVALVGKGICFDTGGHNLKPARSMHGMHEDMNGSAVVLGILLALTRARLPIAVDCWMAIAQNHISPGAYKQNDVVTALNGTTIEIVHTDAEGRMVLADTLTLASRRKPKLIVDFATLTGSMAVALGSRMSGVISNRADLAAQAVAAGTACGERVCAFPFEADYEEALDSTMADIKQCTLDSEADHMLAARFLARFIEADAPWLHVDLSSSNHKGGLGAVGSDVNGFGVHFGVTLLRELFQL